MSISTHKSVLLLSGVNGNMKDRIEYNSSQSPRTDLKNYEQQEKFEVKLGAISEQYESNGNPATISKGKGDKGGASYGCYQFAISSGVVSDYVSESKYYQFFAGLKVGSKEFNAQWVKIAREDAKRFAEDQYQFVLKHYYKPVRDYLNKLNIPDTEAINQMIWSTAVQHGVGKAKQLFELNKDKTELELIKAIYKARTQIFVDSVYYNSTPERRKVRDGVINRYKKELVDVLSMVKTI